MRDPASNCRIEDGHALIELKLRKVNQLFNTLDPSPFLDRDLDDDAQAYIEQTAHEISSKMPFRVVIMLPAAEASRANPRMLALAINRFYAYRVRATHKQLRRTFRQGRLSLAVGLCFLLTCVGGPRLLEAFLPDHIFGSFLSEGLMVIGWVAMWRPVQIFLYDWWPIRKDMEVYRRLSRVRVEVRAVAGNVVASMTM